jgi:hypothetical protein
VIFLEILNKLHGVVVNTLAIFITIATFGLIGYAMSRDKIITAIQVIFSKKVTNE